MPKKVVLFAFFLAFLFLNIPKSYAAISFLISNPQTDGETVTFDVSLSGLVSSSCANGFCYLQAAFNNPNTGRYFGFTQNQNGDWYQYQGSPGKETIKSTFFSFQSQSGSWSGKLTVKVDPQDTEYNGPGNYGIKAWRYSGNSDNYSGWSDNVVTVELTKALPSPMPTPDSTPTPNPSPSSKPSPLASPQTTTIKSSSPKVQVLGEKESSSSSASPKIKASISPSPSPANSKESPAKTKVAGILVGSGVILIGLSMGFYLWYKRFLSKDNENQDQNKDQS